MRLLLDTHTFIWYVTNNSKLSSTAKLLIRRLMIDLIFMVRNATKLFHKLKYCYSVTHPTHDSPQLAKSQ